MKCVLNYRCIVTSELLTLNDGIIELFTLIFQNIKLADSLIIKYVCVFNLCIHATIHAQKCPTNPCSRPPTTQKIIVLQISNL